ncbi:MAG: RNA polymerase sigma factor [Myxococcota bacterium]|nr:RNA polymerase sigma factor [Myxococcota bacterium]
MKVFTDQELAHRVREGDRMAAATLLARHQNSIYGLALRMLRNKEDAEDVTQETMVRALSRIGDYDTSRPLGPWVHRIARNLCIDRFRRKRPSVQINEETTATRPVEASGRSFARPADEVAEQAELNRRLHEALERLDGPYRDIIELYHYKHMSYRDIAEHLGLPDGTVMNRLFRARKKLEVLMREQGVTS